MSFKIVRNDITKIKADAIVNTANPEPVYSAGTDSAVYNAAGAEKLLAERRKSAGSLKAMLLLRLLLISMRNTFSTP